MRRVADRRAGVLAVVLDWGDARFGFGPVCVGVNLLVEILRFAQDDRARARRSISRDRKSKRKARV